MKRLHKASLTLVLYLAAASFATVASAASSEDLVKTGEYLARAGDCTACHTAPGGKPFAGNLYIPTPFGDISSPNLTPDKETGIGNWSDDDFYKAMHEGIGKQGEYLYPVFPFPWFTNVKKKDVLAIKAYLFSLKPVHAPRKPLELSFPANIREGLLAWRTAFFRAGEFVPEKNQSPGINRGKYLVTGLGHCGECHNNIKLAGDSSWSGKYEGGVVEGWYAPNLTSDPHSGIGEWSKEQLTTYLKTGAASGKGVAIGKMRETIDESLKYLTDEDLGAMAAYLKTIKAEPSYKPGRVGDEGRVGSAGAAAYLTYCSSCHQENGKGVKDQIPALAGNGAVKSRGAENVIRVVLGGLEARGGYAPMPAVGAGMSDQEVAKAVNYVRQAWGNDAPANAASGGVADLRKNTLSLLNGSNGPCTVSSEVPIAKNVQKDAVSELHGVNLVNVMTKIDALLPKLKAKEPGVSDDAIVNGMIAAYCPVVLKDTKIPLAQRIAQLGNFGGLVYGRLKNGAKQN